MYLDTNISRLGDGKGNRVYLNANPPAGSGYRVLLDTNLSRLGVGAGYRVYHDTKLSRLGAGQGTECTLILFQQV